MAAPDYPTLYDIETQIENAVQSVFTAAGLTVFTSRSVEDLTTPRVEVQCTLGGPTGHMIVRTGASLALRETPDMFEFTLRVIVVTNRKHNGAQHNGIRGNVRYLLTTPAERFTIANMPYVEFDQIDYKGSSPVIEANKDDDLSEMGYTGVVGIRSDAWPA